MLGRKKEDVEIERELESGSLGNNAHNLLCVFWPDNLCLTTLFSWALQE
jgi:hypothetical protein